MRKNRANKQSHKTRCHECYVFQMPHWFCSWSEHVSFHTDIKLTQRPWCGHRRGHTVEWAGHTPHQALLGSLVTSEKLVSGEPGYSEGIAAGCNLSKPSLLSRLRIWHHNQKDDKQSLIKCTSTTEKLIRICEKWWKMFSQHWNSWALPSWRHLAFKIIFQMLAIGN